LLSLPPSLASPLSVISLSISVQKFTASLLLNREIECVSSGSMELLPLSDAVSTFAANAVTLAGELAGERMDVEPLRLTSVGWWWWVGWIRRSMMIELL